LIEFSDYVRIPSRGKIALLIGEIILSDYLNACDHNPPTLQTDSETTDGRIDRRHSHKQYRATHVHASHDETSTVYLILYKSHLQKSNNKRLNIITVNYICATSLPSLPALNVYARARVSWYYCVQIQRIGYRVRVDQANNRPVIEEAKYIYIMVLLGWRNTVSQLSYVMTPSSIKDVLTQCQAHKLAC